MNIEKLNNAKKVKITFYQPYKVDSDFIKSFRVAKNLSQVELANILGVMPSTVARWERNKQEIKGTPAILLSILYEHKDLFDKIYKVETVECEETN